MHRGAMNRVRSEEAALSRSSECRGKPGPFCAWAQKGPGLPSLSLRLRLGFANRHWRTLPVGPRSAEPTGLCSATHSGRAHGKPGPVFRRWRKRGRACQPFARRLRLALTGRHWRTLPVGPRSAEPPRLCSATHLGRAHGKPGPVFQRWGAKGPGLPSLSLRPRLGFTRTILVRTLAGHACGKVALRLLLRARESAWTHTNLFFFFYLRIRAADSEPARHTVYSGHPIQVLRFRRPGQSPRMPRWLRAKS